VEAVELNQHWELELVVEVMEDKQLVLLFQLPELSILAVVEVVVPTQVVPQVAPVVQVW
jgi:hypothetical protein